MKWSADEETQRNRRWTELSELSSRQVQEKEWQEIKQHVEWLYRRIKMPALDFKSGFISLTRPCSRCGKMLETDARGMAATVFYCDIICAD